MNLAVSFASYRCWLFVSIIGFSYELDFGVSFFGDCNSTLDGAPSLAFYAFEQIAHSHRYRGFRVRPFAPPCAVNILTSQFWKHRVKIGDFHSPSGGRYAHSNRRSPV